MRCLRTMFGFGIGSIAADEELLAPFPWPAFTTQDLEMPACRLTHLDFADYHIPLFVMTNVLVAHQIVS